MAIRTSLAAVGAAACLAWVSAPGARAQTVAPAATSVRLAPPADEGGLAPDPTSVWTIQDENASISTASLTDRYYVNGLRLGFTSGTESTPEILRDLGRVLFGAGQTRYSIDITQTIFTAADTAAYDPPLDDHPYAGVLLGNFGIVQDSPTTRSTFGLGLGVVGPSALAESVQNGFHDIIGQNSTHGWGTQLHDEPVFEFTAGRVWRVPTGSVFGLDTDSLLQAQAGLGTVRVYGLAGIQFRLGQGLDSDYGTARVQPGLSGGDVFRPTRPFAWYVFAGADGQGVGHDITLDGNTWRDSRSVPLKNWLGEFQGGLAIMAYGARLTYTEVVQTQQFEHQKGGLHQFGSLALSVRF